MAAHLRRARVVGTTVASASLATSPVAGAGHWDTVIADEASMLNGATVLFLASLAKSRLLLVGDPCQLGPIVEWQSSAPWPPDVERWIVQDPYEVVGVSSGRGVSKVVRSDDPRMVRVLSQRRCHPRIWALVARVYPRVDSNVNTPCLEKIATVPPLPGEPAVVLDLSSGLSAGVNATDEDPPHVVATAYESACRRVGRSWENPPTAMLALDVAREVAAQAPETKIAIVTPYRGQVRLIKRWLDEEKRAEEVRRLANVEVGTVHSFQGGEADVVIFDVIDGPPRAGLGTLLRDDPGMRLVNVAVTRARAKLVVIAHREWLRHSDSTGASLLWSVLFGENPRPPTCPVLPPAVRPREGYQPAAAGDSPAGPESPIEEVARDRATGARFRYPSVRATASHHGRNGTNCLTSRCCLH